MHEVLGFGRGKLVYGANFFGGFASTDEGPFEFLPSWQSVFGVFEGFWGDLVAWFEFTGWITGGPSGFETDRRRDEVAEGISGREQVKENW